MTYSNATEYAIRGLAELAARAEAGKPLLLDEIVAGTDLPRDFLAKLFQKLVKGGILRSTKGRGGGFICARPPHKITLKQIIEVMEGPQCFDRCIVGLEKCNDSMPCPQHDLYKPIRQRLGDYLSTTTLADLASSLRTKSNWRRIARL
jgi:Rrf2 family transcriptional regulator, iron-sulfur cluster assembly transcription factor